MSSQRDHRESSYDRILMMPEHTIKTSCGHVTSSSDIMSYSSTNNLKFSKKEGK